MKNELLLIEDVDDLGRSGDVVSVKPGFARNFLIPQQKAVVADKHTLRMQQKLREERAQKAVVDKKEAEEMSGRIEGMIVETLVKVDPEGHMYGSVSAMDIIHILSKEGIVLDRKNVVLAHPIKAVGVHEISLKLKEGVPAKFTLKVIAENQSGAMASE